MTSTLFQCVEVDASPSYRARVELYRNSADESRSAPLVAISPPPALEASGDDEFLHELHALWALRTAARAVGWPRELHPRRTSAIKQVGFARRRSLPWPAAEFASTSASKQWRQL